MGRDNRFLNALRSSVILVLFASGLASAGNYDAEMKIIADGITASFAGSSINSVAVLDFTDLQGTSTELGRFLSEELTTNLVIGHKSLNVVDRANLGRILEEHKLSKSGLVNPEDIKKLGKMAGVDALITGTVTPMGNSLRITTKVINTETAKIVGAAKGNVETTPEIADLMRTRVASAPSTAISSSPKAAAQASDQKLKKVKLEQNLKNRYKFSVGTATFDKSSSQMTIFVDFENLHTSDAMCVGSGEPDQTIAIDGYAGRWELVRFVGLQKGLTFDEVRKRLGNATPSDIGEIVTKSYVRIRVSETQRFAIVLKPTKSESSLTITDLSFPLIASWQDAYHHCGEGLGLNVSFNGITAIQ